MQHDELARSVDQARQGDDAAFARVVAATWASQVALARSVLAEHHHEAEDVVQDAYCKAWSFLPKLRSSAAFLTWLRRITMREALRVMRQQPPANGHAVEPTQAPNQQDGDLVRALGRLPAMQRAVLVLGEIEGLGDSEVAASLGIERSTVRVHRLRGRRRLRELLDTGDRP